jgi:hypothetical protein
LKRLAILTKAFTEFPFLETLLTSINYEALSRPVIELADSLLREPFLDTQSAHKYISSLQEIKEFSKQNQLLKTADEKRYFLCCFEWKTQGFFHFGDPPAQPICIFLRAVEKNAKFRQSCQHPYYLLYYWEKYKNGEEILSPIDVEQDGDDNDEKQK